MKLEPGRYKYVRLPVSDLGQGGCGVWEVRPRLGLIGMLAGWWQVKLSSGCPLARGHGLTAVENRSHSNRRIARWLEHALRAGERIQEKNEPGKRGFMS